MIIGIDLDDTLASCIKYFLEFYNNKHTTKFAIDDITKYDMADIFGCSEQEMINDIDDFYLHPAFDTLMPVEGSVEAVHELRKKNDLYVITARPSYLEQKTNKWLDFYYGFSFKDVILTGQVFDKGNAVKKSGVCNYLGAGLMIEDSQHHAYDCASKGIDVLLLDMPWNQSYEPDKRIIKVHSWKDIEKEVKLYK